ncbi:hypothetical protein SYNTR_1642 [Candidatus Syntrophocurvum alkaliphilum]|uniref:Sigma-M negative effector n=1 Tax=Candidatus Syntrophocurvum alkaliphilum TaxID=2293317 RepID=A0A6I6DCA8_9FIRM|nr:anti-sigma factor C-terminal domain-containing protein [Candidatus Syntrophocurvum alkaliphilum]QGU00236.1 hypothetical protein SYNTR_1642 [Candidatus Syntrophocurvum alkaliphilum]
MNCKEFEQLKNNYLNGKLTAEEEKTIEEHLEICTNCQESLNKSLEDDKIQIPKIDTHNSENILDEKKQKKILRRAKYKNRFSITVFLLLLFILFNIAGSFLSSFYFNVGGEQGRLFKAQQTAALLTEFTFPNVNMPLTFRPMNIHFSRAGFGHSSVEIKPYFVAQGEYALEKRIGKKTYIIGHLNINQLLSGIATEWNWKDDSYQNYLHFYHPSQITSQNNSQLDNLKLSNTKQVVYDSDEIWNALDILPEGTVAEMSVSFLQTYTIEEVKMLLEDYDLDITWYAISTGIESQSRYKDHPEPLTAFRGAWGMPDYSRNMMIIGGEKKIVSQTNHIGGVEEVVETKPLTLNDEFREEYFLSSLETLIENEDLAKKIYRGNPNDLRLTEKYDYVKENGIEVYGVVVTGPTKELLKLRDLDTVHSPALGEVELWNWFNRGFEGNLY